MEDIAIRGGQLLALAKMRVIRSTAHWRMKQYTYSVATLTSAIRLLSHQEFQRFIIDEGDEAKPIVQSALDGKYVVIERHSTLKTRLSELNHYWSLSHPVGSHSQDSVSPVLDKNEQLRVQYLELLQVGYSYKEMGQIMGVSVNTIKYHLKDLYRYLQVDNRMRAVYRARELNMIR